jgi:hypothetical protein
MANVKDSGTFSLWLFYHMMYVGKTAVVFPADSKKLKRMAL